MGEKKRRKEERDIRMHGDTLAYPDKLSGCSWSVMALLLCHCMLLCSVSWSTRVHVGELTYFVLYNPRGSLQSSTLEKIHEGVKGGQGEVNRRW